MLNASHLRGLVLWLTCKRAGTRYLTPGNRAGRDEPGGQKAEALQPEAGIQRNEGIKEPGNNRNATAEGVGTPRDCTHMPSTSTSLIEVHCTLLNDILHERVKCFPQKHEGLSPDLSIS